MHDVPVTGEKVIVWLRKASDVKTHRKIAPAQTHGAILLTGPRIDESYVSFAAPEITQTGGSDRSSSDLTRQIPLPKRLLRISFGTASRIDWLPTTGIAMPTSCTLQWICGTGTMVDDE